MPAPWVLAAWAHRRELKNSLQDTEARTELLRELLDDANAAVHAALLAADAARAAFEEADSARSRMQEELYALPLVFDPELVAALPVEMLQAIFRELAFEDDPLWTELHNGRYNHKRAMVPWRLAAVCRKWRMAALNMPEIWTYISVPAPVQDAPAPNGNNLLTRTRVLLERSTTRPLDILLAFDDAQCRIKELDWLQQILLAVAQCAGRWRRTKFAFPKDVDEWDLVFLRQPTPLLEEIAVSIHGGHAIPWKERYPAYLPSCPSLRTLWTTATFVPPQSALTSLVSAHLFVDEHCQNFLWHALCHMPVLQSLSIDFRSPRTTTDDHPTPSPHLRLPHLHSLELSGRFSPVSTWTSTLDIPQISALVLRPASPVEIITLTAFLSSACATIVDLQLGAYASTSLFSFDASQIPALSVFVRLKRVAFDACFVDGRFFDTLNPIPVSQMVWPALHSVSLINPPPGSWLAQVFWGLTGFIGYRVPTRHFNNGGHAPLVISVTGIKTESLGENHDLRSWLRPLGYVLGPSNCHFTDSKGEILLAEYDPDHPDVEYSDASLSDYDSLGGSSDESETDSDAEEDGASDGDDEGGSDEETSDGDGEGGGDEEPSDGDGESGSSAQLLAVSGPNWDSDKSDDSDYVASDEEDEDEEL